MRAVQAFGVVLLVNAMAGGLVGQDREDAARPVAVDELHRGEAHPLSPNHRLNTITLGGFVRPTVGQPLYIVTARRTSVADGRVVETKWPSIVVPVGQTSTIDKVKRREFTISPGSPTAATKLEAAPTIVTLEEGDRAEIRLLESGDDLITMDVTYEELSIDDGETLGVRGKMVAAPQQTARRVRSFRTARLGAEVRIPLDGASLPESQRILLLRVSRK